MHIRDYKAMEFARFDALQAKSFTLGMQFTYRIPDLGNALLGSGQLQLLLVETWL